MKILKIFYKIDCLSVLYSNKIIFIKMLMKYNK